MLLVLADEKSVATMLRESEFAQDARNLCYIEEIVKTLRSGGVYGRDDVPSEEVARLIVDALSNLMTQFPALWASIYLMGHKIVQQIAGALFPTDATVRDDLITEIWRRLP